MEGHRSLVEACACPSIVIDQMQTCFSLRRNNKHLVISRIMWSINFIGYTKFAFPFYNSYSSHPVMHGTVYQYLWHTCHDVNVIIQSDGHLPGTNLLQKQLVKYKLKTSVRTVLTVTNNQCENFSAVPH